MFFIDFQSPLGSPRLLRAPQGPSTNSQTLQGNPETPRDPPGTPKHTKGSPRTPQRPPMTPKRRNLTHLAPTSLQASVASAELRSAYNYICIYIYIYVRIPIELSLAQPSQTSPHQPSLSQPAIPAQPASPTQPARQPCTLSYPYPIAQGGVLLA